MSFSFNTTIEVGEVEIELAVIYDVTPYVPARLYGDYPQPEEGGEVEIISVHHNGAEYPLTDEQEAALQAECEGRASSDIAEELEEAAEWRAQSRLDAIMMWEA